MQMAWSFRRHETYEGLTAEIEQARSIANFRSIYIARRYLQGQPLQMVDVRAARRSSGDESERRPPWRTEAKTHWLCLTSEKGRYRVIKGKFACSRPWGVIRENRCFTPAKMPFRPENRVNTFLAPSNDSMCE